MLLKMIVDKTLLSCIHHVMCMINTFVVCFLPVSYRVHRDLHVPGTWCGEEDMFSSWTYLLAWCVIFERSVRRPSSGGNVPRGRLRAICIYSCAICLFVHDSCAICFLVRDLYSSCTICVCFVFLVHTSFCRSRFEPPTFQHDRFVGPGFDSRARPPVSFDFDKVSMGMDGSLTQNSVDRNLFW